MSTFNGVESAERSPSGKLSFAQRFAASRVQNENAQPEVRRIIPMGGGGGGPSDIIYEPRPEAGWTQVGSRSSPFSRPERRQAPGPSYADYKKKKEEPKPLCVDDEEAFPTLGAGKPKAAAAPKPSGFAAMAASWAARDEADAAEQRRKEQEDDEERQKRERENRSSFMPRIFRATTAPYPSGAIYRPDYEEDCEDQSRPYSPHSPPYDPYYNDEEGPAPAYEGRNAMLEDGEEDNEGWQAQER